MRLQKGQTLFAVVVFLAIIFIFTSALLTYIMNTRIVTQRTYHSVQSLSVAEAGIEKAIWCLNNPGACDDPYTGETTSFGAGQYTTTLTSIGGDYIVDSEGTVNSIKKKLKATISKHATSAAASFYYGVQIGAGGIVMNNNSYIDGNVYSNGTIIASSGTHATGDVYVAGGTALSADQEQTTQSTEFSFGNDDDTEDIAQSFIPGTTEVINYISLYIKKSGNPSNPSVHITADDNGEPSTTALTSGTLNASQVTESFNWIDVSFSSNPELTQGQTYWIVVDVPSTNSSRYFTIGKHDDSGYVNGTGLYGEDWKNDDWDNLNNDYTFKTWMGGLDTYIDGLTIGDNSHTCDDTHYESHHGDAYAHQILNSWVECDAYYDTDPDDIAGSTVGRNKNPDSDDPPPETLPISDAKILDWKDEAESGGIIEGNYTLDGDSTSLGPVKITGNLTVTNGATLTVYGNIWVVGDILFENNSTIQLDPDYTSASGVILNDGKIAVRNNCVFLGSGEEGSYLLVLTTNTSLDENSPAIDIDNNADTVIFYAGKGLIKVANNATLKEATGYKLILSNNASVTYVSGLANAKFTNGPGGIWSTQKSTWQEID